MHTAVAAAAAPTLLSTSARECVCVFYCIYSTLDMTKNGATIKTHTHTRPTPLNVSFIPRARGGRGLYLSLWVIGQPNKFISAVYKYKFHCVLYARDSFFYKCGLIYFWFAQWRLNGWTVFNCTSVYMYLSRWSMTLWSNAFVVYCREGCTF
jgi:hypothetical protein